jgi:hypothetical protein
MDGEIVGILVEVVCALSRLSPGLSKVRGVSQYCHYIRLLPKYSLPLHHPARSGFGVHVLQCIEVMARKSDETVHSVCVCVCVFVCLCARACVLVYVRDKVMLIEMTTEA